MQNLIKYCVQGLKTVKIKGKFQVRKKGMGKTLIKFLFIFKIFLYNFGYTLNNSFLCVQI